MSRVSLLGRTFLAILAFAVTLSAPGVAWAQTAAAEPAQQTQAGSPQAPSGPQSQKAEAQLPKLDLSVTVLAPRIDIPLKDTPAATTVVGDLTLKALPRAVSAEEALQIVPGVKVDNQADGERVHMSIRGQGLLTERGIRGITVLLDGIPLNDPSGFVPDLFDVDWASVGRIEVFRGVASALYGGASAGGIVNIATRDGGGGKAAVDASLTGGSYNFWKGAVSVGGSSGNVNYRVSASANRGDGYRLHTAFDAANFYGEGPLDTVCEDATDGGRGRDPLLQRQCRGPEPGVDGPRPGRHVGAAGKPRRADV